jgi:hypothetical protein
VVWVSWHFLLLFGCSGGSSYGAVVRGLGPLLRRGTNASNVSRLLKTV